MGWGDGLAWADASTRTTAKPVKPQPELAFFSQHQTTANERTKTMTDLAKPIS